MQIGSYNTAIVTSLIVLAMLTTAFGTVAACAPFDIAVFFKEAQAVFVGRVMATKAVRTGLEWNEVHTLATLRVERALRERRPWLPHVTPVFFKGRLRWENYTSLQLHLRGAVIGNLPSEPSALSLLR